MHSRPHLLCALTILLAGCSATRYQAKPFFLTEQELDTHGRKTWLDRLIETDPGHATCTLADGYQTNPPRKIAVLPFADEGDGRYVVNKVPLDFRNEDARARWSWTHANRLRRAISGDLGAREFVLVPPLAIDWVLANRSITDAEKLNAIPPEELGRWLNADTLVYGTLVNYEAYYAFLIAAWRVSVDVRMVSADDGHAIFSCSYSRYEVTLNPAISPVDIAIQSVLALLQLRDISLARTEYEVGREIVIRLPIAQRNISNPVAGDGQPDRTAGGTPAEDFVRDALSATGPYGASPGPCP